VHEAYVVDVEFEHADGRRERIRKVSPVRTRRGAEQYERQLREDLLMGRYGIRNEVPTFGEWFNGRYWREWVTARKNKESTTEAKKSVYKHHLEKVFGHVRLDEITEARIASFRAKLIQEYPREKTVNNVLAVLSKPLRYAEDAGVIQRAPKVGLLPVERPEIEFWEMAEYARLLDAAKREGLLPYAAVCLAGEAGLRVGEVKALRWREDVDMVAGTITVNRQMRRGVVGTPKGRTRRTIPMTQTLFDALRSLQVVREGVIIKGLAGQAKNDENQLKNMMYRVCRLAGLPERGWHALRHSFGTHGAMLGVNPWRLMTWMGHKRIDETLRYVHMAEGHPRDLPQQLLDAVAGEHDPDRRVLRMLGARVAVPPRHTDGTREEVTPAHLRLVAP
jgi:integrase